MTLVMKDGVTENVRLWSESNADGDEAQRSADADSAAAPADLKDVPEPVASRQTSAGMAFVL